MYDLVIIGAGPAGLTASIYASCFRLSHLLLSANVGGQMLTAPHILNYPGFTSIHGQELTSHMLEQVKARGGDALIQSVITIAKNETDGSFTINTKEGQSYQSKTILLATGTERKKLNVPGEQDYTGKGVHYCTTCEKFDYEGKICAVVGGANSAVQGAVQLAHAAKKVYILYRGIELRGDGIWLEEIKKTPTIEVLYGVTVKEIRGDGQKITDVLLDGTEVSPLPIERLFIEIGGVPGTALIVPLGAAMDPGGYIHVNEKMETTIPGIFAAGDLVTHAYSLEQISTAVGLGARATASIFSFLKKGTAPNLWGDIQIPH